ncbi:MAG: ParB/RepB/Spo0J family partition protein [Acidobacteria bacterium]|nr:ParB/RepB/Spo0J family partition protein [Acidobacteriota bacterium]
MTGSLTLREIACGSVQVAGRHRRDMGDLEVLATSIATEGLLQPIGVTEENTLVFGERRLLAVRDILREPTIVARVVHVSSILAGEYAENEIRKEFTPSERVEIGKALEAQLGERRGRDNREYIPELKGRRTTELAAEKAGFGNRKTYDQAKRVVDHGAPELVEAMDAGEISIQAAAVIATEPPERQTEVVQMPRELRRQVVREIREAAKLPTPSEARRIARETGMSVADNTGVYRSGSSPEVVRLAKADMRAIYDATRGIVAIADTTLDPTELASRLEYWHCPDIREKSTMALDWLNRFVKGLENNEQIQ